MPNNPTKPTSQMTDEEMLRAVCEPCEWCIGDNSPLSRFNALAAIGGGQKMAKCPHCMELRRKIAPNPDRIRALMDRVQADEREMQFKDIKRIIADYHDEHRAKANSDRCSMYGNRVDRESWMHNDKANAAEDLLNSLVAAIRARSNKDSKDKGE